MKKYIVLIAFGVGFFLGMLSMSGVCYRFNRLTNEMHQRVLAAYPAAVEK